MEGLAPGVWFGQFGASITARGAGTSQAGQAIGPGVQLDFSKYLNRVLDFEPEARREPSLDGSALEHFGQVVAIPLAEALDHCRSGVITDAKTELALRRLRERVP